MADWRDVMNARSEADGAAASVDAYASNIEDGRRGDPTLAALLAASAICAELRALGVVLNYATEAFRGD